VQVRCNPERSPEKNTCTPRRSRGVQVFRYTHGESSYCRILGRCRSRGKFRTTLGGPRSRRPGSTPRGSPAGATPDAREPQGWPHRDSLRSRSQGTRPRDSPQPYSCRRHDGRSFRGPRKRPSPRPYCHPGSAKTLVWDRQSPTSSGLLSGRVLPMVAAGNQPSHSVRPCMSPVHLPVRPWSPRSQGFPRGGDAGRTEAPRRPAVTSCECRPTPTPALPPPGRTS